MGKPIYSEKLADEVVGGVGRGMTDEEAALAAGISSDTFGRWMKAQRGAPAELADRIVRARAQRARLWLGEIAQIARDTRDWRAYAELLDRCSPTYRKSATLEHTGKDGGPIQHTHRDLSVFDDDEVVALAEMAERRKAGALPS